MVAFLTFIGILLAAAGPTGAFYEYVSPFLGGAITAAGGLILALLFFVTIVTFLRHGAKATNWLAFFLGFASLGALGAIIFLASLNPINDITTDAANPPKFLHPTFPFKVEKGAEFLDASLQLQRDYNPAFPAIQLTTYPGFEGISAKAPAKDVFLKAMDVIRTQLPGWKIVLEDQKTFHAEMEVSSQLFHFVDDVVLEARPTPKHNYDCRLELRSRSRIGKSDLGANIRRLRELKVRLNLALKPMDEAFFKERNEWEQENMEEPAAKPAPPASPEKKK